MLGRIEDGHGLDIVSTKARAVNGFIPYHSTQASNKKFLQVLQFSLAPYSPKSLAARHACSQVGCENLEWSMRSSLIGKLRCYYERTIDATCVWLLLLARLKSQALFYPKCSVRSNEFIEMSLVLCTCRTKLGSGVPHLKPPRKLSDARESSTDIIPSGFSALRICLTVSKFDCAQLTHVRIARSRHKHARYNCDRALVVAHLSPTPSSIESISRFN